MDGVTAGTGEILIMEVAVHGALNAETVPQVRQALQDAQARNPQQIIVDLASCSSIDAAGIYLLLDAHRQAIHSNGVLTLRSPAPQLTRNLFLARADQVLHVIGGPNPAHPYESATQVADD